MDFNFLFILLFVAMSIADAVSRRRKKRERIEEMDRQEREEWSQGTRTPTQSAPGKTHAPREDDPRAGVEEWEWEGSGTATRGELPPATQRSDSDAREGNSPRETADTLIPDDLWAILTGEAPQPRQPPPPQRSPTPSTEGEDLSTQPWKAGPRRDDPAPYSQRTNPSPAPPSEARPRIPKERAGRGPLPTRDRPSSPAPRFPSPARAGSERAKHAPDLSEVPWRDIAVGEIGSEGGSLQSPLGGKIGAPAMVARRSIGASAYVRDLRGAGREGLRTAIVLQEVLGPPVSLRPAEKRIWEAWEG